MIGSGMRKHKNKYRCVNSVFETYQWDPHLRNKIHHWITVQTKYKVWSSGMDSLPWRSYLCWSCQCSWHQQAWSTKQFRSKSMKELILCGCSIQGHGHESRVRLQAMDNDALLEEEDCEHCQEFQELEAVDLTGCISGIFFSALTKFVNTSICHYPFNISSDDERARGVHGRRWDTFKC